MSAARNIPFEYNLTVKNFPIDSTFTPNPQGVILGVGESISFTNNSGAEISLIQFNPNPLLAPSGPGPTLFTNVTNLQNGATSATLAPSPTEGSVNYYIFDMQNNQYGPFSIQVGAAVPLSVQIINSVPSPSKAAVPQNGKVIFYSDDRPCNPNYDVIWGTNGDPLNPVLQTPACGFQNNAIRAATGGVKTYSYNIPNDIATGGGKVIVQG